MERITLYRITRYLPGGAEEQYSLLPWDGGGEGEDDGGRDYLLPAGYGLTEEGGAPLVTDAEGRACEVQWYNGAPVLVDRVRRQAILLEWERKLQNRREEAGLSRAELSAMLGMTQKELYEIEAGEREATTGFYRRAAQFLGCAWQELI